MARAEERRVRRHLGLKRILRSIPSMLIKVLSLNSRIEPLSTLRYRCRACHDLRIILLAVLVRVSAHVYL